MKREIKFYFRSISNQEEKEVHNETNIYIHIHIQK